MTEDAAPQATREPKELILLTPFSFPTHNALYLGDEDVVCFLNGYLALWHPAALRLAGAPPRLGSPYDFDQPSADHVYALPEDPPPVLPEDWEGRARQAGAVVFRAVADREETLENLKRALRDTPELGEDVERLAQVDAEKARPFFGLGFGYGHLEALFEAMDHENLMDFDGIWSDVTRAIDHLLEGTEPEDEEPLKLAAQRLLEAREVLYPVAIYLLDFFLLDEERMRTPMPASLDLEIPLNVIASGAMLEKLAESRPEDMERLRRAVAEERAEVCGGSYVEREESLLPIESQLWNLVKGTSTSEQLLGQELKTHGRKRFYAHPQTPAFLQAVGMERALLLAFDEAVLPYHHATVFSWPSLDGKQVDAYTRMPRGADSPQTFFHAAHYLNETIMHDHAATFALMHTGEACPWYRDWLELNKLAPVLGQWMTLSQYIEEVSAGDYASPCTADELHADHLSERLADPETPPVEHHEEQLRLRTFQSTEESRTYPVSGFAHHARVRRELDAARTFAALFRSLAGQGSAVDLVEKMEDIEDRLERAAPLAPNRTELAQEVEQVMQQAAEVLAERLQSRAEENRPGYMILNPCGFPRRVVMELEDVPEAIPYGGKVRVSQWEENRAKLVVEVPALGFTWIPASGESTGKPSKLRMADERCVRNEHFEAEIDHTTGGLKGLRDHRLRINRVGQQLVFNPGSVPRITEVRTTATGPAYGEIVTEGELLNEHGEVLAKFQQRFRAWSGRPVLDLHVDIEPVVPPEGYPWHNYFGSRFAWADERAPVVRGIGSMGHPTGQTRTESPDFIEIQVGPQKTLLLPCGLPFHQRQGGRMLDMILVPPGEQCQSFDMAIGLDRDYPLLTAYGMVSPVGIVRTTKGPPHIGESGWLFHLDAPNLLLTSLSPAPEGADGVVARLIECQSHPAQAQLRCVRDPVRVELQDARGQARMEGGFEGDVVHLEVAETELLHVRVDFS